MGRILIGLLFVVLNFNVSLNYHTLNLIPNFVGYILIVLGCGELSGESGYFSRARVPAAVLAVLEGFNFLMNLFGLGIMSITVNIIRAAYNLSGLISIAGTAGFLLTTYLIVYGISDIEQNRNEYLASDSLKTYWLLSAAAHTVAYAFLFLMLETPAFIMSIGAMVFVFLFIFSFYKTKRMYEAQTGF